jgi:membrane-associated protease RseP (regulator of RpoE activity)
MIALGILGFVVALLVSVMLHEAGHFLTARKFGMKATQFFVGFGPTLWSRHKGETEYGVKAIPAGGFVKIVGMTPLEDVAPEDQPRAFYRQPAPQRLVVLAAGSAVHFIIGIVLFAIFFAAYPATATGAVKVAGVSPCLTQTSQQRCTSDSPASPAQGKLESGDTIVAVDGHKLIGGTKQLVELTSAAVDRPVTYTIKRHGQSQDVTMTPVVVDGHARVGISIDAATARVSPFAAVGQSFNAVGQSVTGSFKAMGSVPHELMQIVKPTQQERTISDGSGQVTSVVGVARFTGQAFDAGGLWGGIGTLIAIVAAVNIFVGVFNMLPLLPLDGGHVAILLFEKIRSGIARVLRRPDPGRVDLNKLLPVTYMVLAVFIGVSLLLVYADIFRPVANPFQ